jgi:hypothetical protein
MLSATLTPRIAIRGTAAELEHLENRAAAGVTASFLCSGRRAPFGNRRRTGNLRAVQLLLGRSKIETIVRYLGIEVDDAIEIAEKIDI